MATRQQAQVGKGEAILAAYDYDALAVRTLPLLRSDQYLIRFGIVMCSVSRNLRGTQCQGVPLERPVETISSMHPISYNTLLGINVEFQEIRLVVASTFVLGGLQQSSSQSRLSLVSVRPDKCGLNLSRRGWMDVPEEEVRSVITWLPVSLTKQA